MSQQLTISSLFSVCALAALCLMTGLKGDAMLSDAGSTAQEPGAFLAAPAPMISAAAVPGQIN